MNAPIRHRIRLWVLLAAIWAGGIGAWAEGLPNPFPPGCVTVLPPLANGLRVVVLEDHARPLVAMQVVVRSGAAAEADAHGVAHYLEHVVFQGSAQFPAPLSAEFALEAVGGASNAVTSRDTTRFFGMAPADQVERLIAVLADVICAPALTDERCAGERATIAAELAHEKNRPVAELVNLAHALTFPDHPYRFAAKGTEADLAQVTPAALRAFHAQWYVPNNMSVILTGDVTPNRAQALVQQTFGTYTSVALPVDMPGEDPAGAWTESRVAHVSRAVPDTYQAQVFAVAGGGDASAVAARDLLTNLLADGPDAVLPAQWARDGVRVKSFGVECVASRGPGRLIIWAQTDPAMASRWRESTQRALRNCAGDRRLTTALLAPAKHRLLAGFLRENETLAQQAATLAFFAGLGDAEWATQYAAVVQGITAEQLRAVMPTREIAWITLGQPPKG